MSLKISKIQRQKVTVMECLNVLLFYKIIRKTSTQHQKELTRACLINTAHQKLKILVHWQTPFHEFVNFLNRSKQQDPNHFFSKGFEKLDHDQQINSSQTSTRFYVSIHLQVEERYLERCLSVKKRSDKLNTFFGQLNPVGRGFGVSKSKKRKALTKIQCACQSEINKLNYDFHCLTLQYYSIAHNDEANKKRMEFMEFKAKRVSQSK